MSSHLMTRIWHGTTEKEKSEQYSQILRKTGIKDYKRAAGIRSVKILRKNTASKSHFWIVTEWQDMAALEDFTSGDPDKAQYYREDENFLLKKEDQVLNVISENIYGELNGCVQTLKDLFSGQNWVCVSVSKILNDLCFEKAITKKIPNRHSIYEIVHHSLMWRIFLLSRLKETAGLILEQNDHNDWPERSDCTEVEWDSLKEQYFRIQEELIENLNLKDDQLLEAEVSGRSYNFRHLINGIIQHDYYHWGQISLLR